MCSEKCVTDSCYPPHQKMMCIKASCVSMRGWHVLMFLHFRRSVRSQRCKRRQISPPKGDLQRVLGAVTYPQRESVQRFSFSAFTLGKPVDKWSQRPTLWVCCNCREPGSGRYFLDFLSLKGAPQHGHCHQDFGEGAAVLYWLLSGRGELIKYQNCC